MPLALLPFLLLVIPIAEIAVFITLGGYIGLWPTLGMIVVTAIIGTILLRLQGFQLINEIQRKTEAGEIPGRALVHGVMLLVAGVLLLTPGFVTDTFGFLLFVPPFRDAVWHFIKSRTQVKVFSQSTMDGFTTGNPSNPGGPSSNGPTIDLDETDYGPSNPDSPWNNKQS